ncbi:uncharacterized protein LAJ45_00996 [Morchella importuna]|uniref:uncharacterized protein n=1 Tax=Morchella importuna TaxID=1174673 RepID=UPI001E8D2330|nr:uncharacterized protein LAJ45_00996 [Morchella importuna]KAH8154469.1 hypothetical protein LAJ45_00996 [Morchella importuna]
MQKAGISYSGIKRATGVKKRTAINIVNRAKSRAGKNAKLHNLLSKEKVEPTPKSGRPATISERDKRYLIRLVERPENRRATLPEIADISGLQISRESVRKILKDSGGNLDGNQF